MTCDTDDEVDGTLSIPGSSGSTTVECFEGDCEEEIHIAIWEDNTLAGKYLPVCTDCEEERPEFNLWDATAIEEKSDVTAPDERSEHPIPEGGSWAVIDSSPQSLEEFNERYPSLPEGMYDPDDHTIEIFLRNPEDTEALEAARDEARERFDV